MSALSTMTDVLTWSGYGLLGGTLAVWLLAWPAGPVHRGARGLALGGATLMAGGTLGGLLVRTGLDGVPPGEVVAGVSGTWVLVRLAALAAVLFFAPELFGGPAAGPRRSALALLVVALASGLTAGSTGAPGPDAGTVVLVLVATQVLALAAVVGGVVVRSATLRWSPRPPLDLPAQLGVIVVAALGVLLAAHVVEAVVVGEAPVVLVALGLAVVALATTVWRTLRAPAPGRSGSGGVVVTSRVSTAARLEPALVAVVVVLTAVLAG